MELNSRSLAALVEVLAALLDFSEPADTVLHGFFRANPKLGKQERGFVAETAYVVLRHKRSLEKLIGGRATPRQFALVALSKYAGIGTAKLKSLLSAREADWLADLKSRSVELTAAERAELPDWLYDRLAQEYSSEELSALADALNRPAPLDLRVNIGRTSRDEVLRIFREQGLDARPTPYATTGIRLPVKIALAEHSLFKHGLIEVQDEGSQLLALLVAPKRREMVADFCAGAGGKTLALGALMHSQGRLYAFDVSQKRLDKFSPRLNRSGLSNVQVQTLAHERDARLKRLHTKLDRVLVDAPCSGLGTLRRNPDLKWRQQPRDIVEMQAKQLAIATSAAKLVKPGGRLIYATCSLLRAENEEVVNRLLDQNPQFSLLNCAEILSQQHVNLDTGTYLKLAPDRHATDGFFAAVMQRNN